MKLYVTLCLFLFTLLLSSCALELAELGEVGVADASVTAGEGAALEASSMELAEGRLTITNEASLEKIKLLKSPGENPKLYVEGRSEPFAEVFPEEEKARLLGHHSGEFAISENIFSVEGEVVNVRTTPSTFSSQNIITKVHHGNLVVVLSEDAGWYQVKIAQNGHILTGWINGLYLFPLVGDKLKHHIGSNGVSYQASIPRAIIYPDTTKIKNDLVGKSISNWKFDNQNEIADMKVNEQQFNGTTLNQNLELHLLNETNNEIYVAQVMVTYNLQGNHWMLNNISQSSFSGGYSSSSYPVRDHTDPTYNVGYLLQHHRYIPSFQLNSERNTPSEEHFKQPSGYSGVNRSLITPNYGKAFNSRSSFYNKRSVTNPFLNNGLKHTNYNQPLYSRSARPAYSYRSNNYNSRRNNNQGPSRQYSRPNTYHQSYRTMRPNYQQYNNRSRNGYRHN